MMPDSAARILLAADIGGTHSRFALFSLRPGMPLGGGALRLVRTASFATASFADTAGMMRTLARTAGDDGGFFTPASPDPVRVDASVFGVPGPASPADPSCFPATDAVCVCPNIVWPLEAAPVVQTLGGAPVRFINDFAANGFACTLAPEVLDLAPVRPGVPLPGFPRAVIGAGTGIGHCLMLPGGTVVGAEAGHMLFPFVPGEEALVRHYAAHYGTDRLDGDQVVAGSGLAVLYAFVTGEKHHPHAVFSLAARNAEVMALAAGLYGRAVRQYVLATMALGGVFITGGLAAALPGILSHPAFGRELEGEGSMQALLAALPLSHVRNRATGLWGAAVCAALGLSVPAA